MRAVPFLAVVVGLLVLVGSSSGSVSVNVKLTVTVAGKGTVTSAPKGIACPKTCSSTAPTCPAAGARIHWPA